MKKYSLIRAVFALVTASAITLSFAACGASSGGSAAQTNSSAAYDAAYEEEIGVEAPAEEAMISENKVNPDTAGTALSEGISQTTMPDNLNLKLIWRANVSMETLEFDQSVQQVTDLVTSWAVLSRVLPVPAVRMHKAITSINTQALPSAFRPIN